MWQLQNIDIQHQILYYVFQIECSLSSTFLQAGRSQLTQDNATRNVADLPSLALFLYARHLLILQQEGLDTYDPVGPGRRPTNIKFSSLYLNSRGKFCTVRYIAPKEYCVCMKGWNQSTFIVTM